MDIFPIWKSTFYESDSDSVKFRILKWGVQEICRATAVRLPDDELLRIGLNKPCQNFLDSNIDVSATGTTSSNAYAEFSLQIWNESNSQWFNAYEFAFVNDWSYGEHDAEGSFSEPINGHAAPGQLIPYSVMSTGLTGETICYDEYDFTAYLTVTPSTITFDQTGGTATITIFSNTNWYITQYGNLVSLSQTSGTSGTTTITVTCNENLVIREFYDTLRVRADKQGTTAIEYVHITQEAATPYVRVTSGDNEVFDTSGSTWTVTYQTNIPRLYYEMSDGTNTITGYTSNGRVSFNLPPVTGSTDYTLNFYDEPGGTLYATANAEQTIYYFNFLNNDYDVVTRNTTAYTATWDTNYSSVTIVYGSQRITTSDTGATFTFPANTGETEVVHTLYAYSGNGRLIGTLHWRQMSVLSAEYLSLVATGFTGSETLTLKYGSRTGVLTTLKYSTDNGNTWETLSATTWSNYNRKWTTVYIPVSPGDKVLFKDSERNTADIEVSMSSGYCDLEGNYMSLVHGDNFENNTEFGNWFNLIGFRGDIKNAKDLVLPAYNAVDWIYAGMLNEVAMLETAPNLPAGVVGEYAYYRMFRKCTNLVTPPVINATVVGRYACASMFEECTSLRTAPALPATELRWGCYSRMFWGCSSLEQTPVLPDVNVPEKAYNEMFALCSNLNRIECYAVSSGYSDTFAEGWAAGVAIHGTFVQNPEMIYWLKGGSGNPWWYEEEEMQHLVDTGTTGDYESQYTTLEILTDGLLCFHDEYDETCFGYDHTGPGRLLVMNGTDKNFYYSINGGDWKTACYDNKYYDSETQQYYYPFGEPSSSVTVHAGDIVRLKSVYELRHQMRLSDLAGKTGNTYYTVLGGSTCEFNVYGNALSLIYGDDFRNFTELMPKHRLAYTMLFANTGVKSAENWILPWGAYPAYSMDHTFSSTPIVKAPVLHSQYFYDNASRTYRSTFYAASQLCYVEAHMEYVPNEGFELWMNGAGSHTENTRVFKKKSGVNYRSDVNGIPNYWTVEEFA